MDTEIVVKTSLSVYVLPFKNKFKIINETCTDIHSMTLNIYFILWQ
uniref:Uncharacterized protein n=1 Tax=Meloidogyne enterolobii TaxID=390850 RepID=A0A6V7W1H1_MELEN|nr:unnamed protein product [Meloidogyne enterolobii]